MMWKSAKDAVGNVIIPGDVCVYASSSRGCIYVVFSDTVWGGTQSKGEYGRFLSEYGISSIKYSNVLLAYDPMSSRRSKIVSNELTRKFYEQGK